MPNHVGPNMLANLDRQYEAGSIDQHTHAARKLEVQEPLKD